MTDDRTETITAETDNPTVCITHGRFIPCRDVDWHQFTDNPYWVKSVRDFQGSDDPNLTWEPATLTITDPAEIRATDEPDERGDFPCCATPAPVGAAVELDLDAARAMLNAANTIKATGGAVEIGGVRIEPCDEYGSTVTTARAESAEAEVGTLRAKVAEAEAKRDEFADLLARALPAVAALARVEALGDSNPDHADTCGSMLTPGAGYPCSCWQADLRAALATTGEGQ